MIMSSAMFLQDGLTRRWSHEGLVRIGYFVGPNHFLISCSELCFLPRKIPISLHPDPRILVLTLYEVDLINNCQLVN